MKNIFDYAKKFKNKTFNKAPFNEVDGLILAELIYTKFNGVLDENSVMDIKDVNKLFWDMHSEEEIIASSSFTKMSPFLMKEMANSKRYKGTKFKYYVSEISLSSLKQFAALTIELPDGYDFIAYRGTDGTVAGWMEDFKFSYSTTEGQEDAVNYMNKYHKDNKRPLRIGGHSKGGNLAVYAGVFCKKKIQDNIECVYSYDGPGFKMNILNSKEYQRILPRIISIVPKDCMVGIMMNNLYKTIITDSDRFAIFEHDAYQWHIEGDHFARLDVRSDFSLFFEKVLNNWLEKVDENKRREILESIINMMVENEVVSKDDLKLSPTFFYNFFMSMPKLTDEEKDLLISSLAEFISSTSSVTADEIKEMTTNAIEKAKHLI